MSNSEPKGDIALIGLAVMGQNLILNMNDHGYTVVAYNRTVSKVDEFLAKEAKGTKVIGAHSIEEMCKNLKRPRRVMMLVKAGQAVDDFIEQVIPYLEKGDIIIDGGNSLFEDTVRRVKYLESKGFLLLVLEFPVEKKALAGGLVLCPAVPRKHGPMLNLFFKTSPQRWMMDLLAVIGLVRGALAIM